EQGTQKWWWLLLFVNVLAVSQSHVPTIFIVYCISIAFYLITYVLRSKQYWSRSILVLLAIFISNAFWGLPYIYSAINNAEIITNSKINRLSNEEIVLRNQ